MTRLAAAGDSPTTDDDKEASVPYVYDDQLFGKQRIRFTWQDRVSTFIGSLVLAVVICTVCVAIAFVMYLFQAEALKQQQQQQRYAPVSTSATP